MSKPTKTMKRTNCDFSPRKHAVLVKTVDMTLEELRLEADARRRAGETAHADELERFAATVESQGLQRFSDATPSQRERMHSIATEQAIQRAAVARQTAN